MSVALQVEKLNNIAINVFGYEDVLHPLHLTKSEVEPINVLLYEGHYCWIKDFNRLCYDQNKHKARTYFCLRCLSSHNTEEALERHRLYCNDTKPVHAIMPELDENEKPPTLQFVNEHKRMKCPYIIYADTESIIEPYGPQTVGGNTTRSTKHTACSFGYVVVRSDGEMTSSHFYRGEEQSLPLIIVTLTVVLIAVAFTMMVLAVVRVVIGIMACCRISTFSASLVYPYR